MISVVIPFKDAEKYLPRCLNSLTSQEGDFEFIFVDDDSTDNGRDIVDSNDDHRIVITDNVKAKGVGGARNTGVAIASGDWVTFLDADDELLPNAYETFTKGIAEDPFANIIQFNHLRYYAQIDKTAFKYANNGGAYDCDNLPKCWYGVWNKLYNADFLKGVKFNEKLNYGEDGLFILDCLAKDNYIHHAGYNDTTVKHYFDNPKSLSKSKKETDLFKYVKELEAFIKKHKSPTIRWTACKVLSDEWKSISFKTIIGKQK